MEMSLIWQEFGHKPKCWTNLNFDLVMVLDGKLRDDQVITSQPEGDMNVRTKFHGNQSNSRQGI